MRRREILKRVYDSLVAESKPHISPMMAQEGDRKMMLIMLEPYWSAVNFEEAGERGRLTFFMCRQLGKKDLLRAKVVEENVVSLSDNPFILAMMWSVAFVPRQPVVWEKGKGCKVVELLDVVMNEAGVLNFPGSKQSLELMKRTHIRIVDSMRSAEEREAWEAELFPGQPYDRRPSNC